MGLAKTVALNFKNLPDRLPIPAALFSSIFLRIFDIVSSNTKLDLNLELGNFKIFT